MSGKRSRMMRRAYNKVKALKPARNLFDLSHEWLASGDMGKLYPCCYMEMSPGDTFHIWQQIVTRMMPLNAPILHEIFLYTHFFFVPYRILWEEWTDFITGSVDGDNGGSTRTDYTENIDHEKEIEYPTDVTPELPRWNPTDNSVGSLWDYLSFPTGVKPAGAFPLDFIRRCYNRIWNEYYRDENLQEEVSESNEQILYRNWKKDYFTSALRSQQRGIAPAMPVSGHLNIDVGSGSLVQLSSFSWQAGNKVHYNATVPGKIEAATISNYQTSVNVFRDTYSSEILAAKLLFFNFSFDIPSNQTYVTADFEIEGLNYSPVNVTSRDIPTFSYSKSPSADFESSNVGFDVKDLRQAFQIQKWLELANRGGVRYTEFLRSFFGVSPKDDRLQRPEYIGGTKSPVIISEVLQTSQSQTTPQGTMTGHGVGASRTYVGSYTATEYGIVMGLLSVMPTTKYTQGINKQWLRRSKYDFLFPQFTGLSEQAIEEAEVFATNDSGNNKKVFGFGEIYDELRSMSSKIVGKMRTVFNYWHLARIFDSPPALNSDFIQCKPSKRIFAVPAEDGFIFDVANIIRAVRPIPKYGTPKGV